MKDVATDKQKKAKPIRRFIGHQNTYTNFVRACFGPSQNLVIGGSEDGFVYIWDMSTGNILQRLGGHKDTTYQPVWNANQGLIARYDCVRL